MKLSLRSLTSIALSAVVLAACGGVEKGPPVVSITSPADGAVINGSRDITVAGTLSSPSDVTSVEVRLNGAAVTGTSFTQGDFSAPLHLADRANTVEVVVTNAAGEQASASLSLEYPFAAFASFQEATLVIGQPDFVTNQTSTVDGALVYTPYGDPGLNDGVLYLPDYGNRRILGFATVPESNGASADFVLGQPDLTTATRVAAPSAINLDGAQTVRFAEGKLFAVDYGSDRIVVFDPAPTATQPAATLVIGQADLTTDDVSCTASTLYDPESFFIAGTKLIVADSNHNRVLIWNAIPETSGVPADLVLGQKDFVSCVDNDADGDGVPDAAPSATSMSYPSDVWSDGTRLLVVDVNNNRVLLWNEFPTASQAPADLALGQASLTSAESATTANGLAYPYYLASNGNQIFVADSDNNRVLVWDAFPAVSGQAADRVLGQGDFLHGVANDANQDGVAEGPSARTFSFPSGLLLDGTRLFVSDNENSRYLVFDAQ